ncbi:MAG: putative translation initiation inhibitor, yjgF family [Bacillota bacterium]|jgi:enamine deaminase RidA (YjgF/YER057c/UK114 family)|nr:putative translation initiation inhibitor, yjgF family [Bacillota bacterium]
MSIEKQSNPIPQGKYVPATRGGNFIYTAGMTPRNNGVLILTGKVKYDEPIETYREAVKQATKNSLTAARNMLKENEQLERVLSLSVFVNADENFTDHSKLADFASDYLFDELGEAGIGCRAAIGVYSLPGNAPVEVQMVLMVSN